MGPADQNIAAKRLQDQNLRKIINGGTSSSNPTNAVDTQISNNAGKNLNAPALGLAIDQTVGGTPNPDAPKVQQLSSTGESPTLNFLSNVSEKQIMIPHQFCYTSNRCSHNTQSFATSQCWNSSTKPHQ